MASRTPYVGTQSTGDVLTSANFDKLPNGLVAYKINDTPTTSIGTTPKDINNCGITYTFLSDRWYKFECRMRMGNPDAAQRAWVELRTGSTIWTIMTETFFTAAGGNSIVLMGGALYTPPAGSTSVKLTGRSDGGSGGSHTWDEGPGGVYPDNTGPDWFAIYDLGPATF